MALASFVHVMDVEDRRQLALMFRGVSTLAMSVPVVRLNVRDGRGELRRTAEEVLAIARSVARQAMTNRR